MSGSTVELALKTAVDADDTADYLTISLASSLQTLDATYNNTTGHTHNGAHQGGPIGTIPASAIPAGSIDSSKILDGSIATADIANQAVTNAKLGTDTARLNLLTNGGFEIWQRGNGPFTASGAWLADRWVIGLAGSDTLSISRDSANADTSVGSTYCAACTFTLSGGAGASGFFQLIKQADGHQVANRTLTFSARVRTNTANAVRLGFHNGSAWSYSSFHSGGGTYETLSVTATAAG